MKTARMEAFSDGVFAIIITIMVLELKVPHGEDLEAPAPLLPVFLSYVLSFVHVGIFWNNHHHMLNTTRHTSRGMLWANLHTRTFRHIITLSQSKGEAARRALAMCDGCCQKIFPAAVPHASH